MSRSVFLNVQIPFVDFRKLTSSPPHALHRPSWPKPAAHEFVRRFGAVDTRRPIDRSHDESEWLTSKYATGRHYVDCKKILNNESVSLERIFRYGSDYNLRPIFFRLIGDQPAIVRFELGFLITTKSDYSWKGQDSLVNFLSVVLSGELFALSEGTPGKPQQRKTLASIAATLRRRYFTATELHDGSGSPNEFNPKLLKPLDWSLVVQLPRRDHFAWLARTSILNPNGARGRKKGIAISHREIRKYLLNWQYRHNWKDVKPNSLRFCSGYYAIGNLRSGEEKDARAFRIAYLRLRAEILSLWTVTNEIQENGVLSEYSDRSSPKSDQNESLARYLTSSLDRITDTLNGNNEIGPTSRAVAEALRLDDLFTPELIDQLHTRCGHLVERRQINRSAENLIINAVGESIAIGVENSNTQVGEVKMSKYSFEGPTNIGAVGDNASASDFTQGFATGTVSEVEMKKLSEQLQLLILDLREKNNDDPEATVSIAHLEGAKTAIDQGDTSTAMDYLKAAGQWVLEKASAIGVPVAIAAIKGALGLK
ncbi:MAG: hypothetical protein AAF720_01430 [Pseudomonadota bacterium]